jgi:hypothetical protein
LAVDSFAAAASAAAAGTAIVVGIASAEFVHGLVIAVSASSALFYLCYTTLAAPLAVFVALLCRSAMRLLLGGIVYDYEVGDVGLGGVSVVGAAVGTVRCPLCYTTLAAAALAVAPLLFLSPRRLDVLLLSFELVSVVLVSVLDGV